MCHLNLHITLTQGETSLASQPCLREFNNSRRWWPFFSHVWLLPSPPALRLPAAVFCEIEEHNLL